MKYFFAAIFTFFVFAGCNTTKSSTSTTELSALEGTWQLTYITGPRIAFEELYPDNKPTITFEIKKKKVVGNTTCNSFSLPLTAEGKKMNFDEPMTLTKMFCRGEAETIFLQNLKKVDRYDVFAGYTLSFFMGDVALMRFTKVK